MIFEADYRRALRWALGLHVLLLILLSFETSHKSASLAMGAESKPVVAAAQPEVVKAFSVDSSAVDSVVNKLKEERLQEQQAKTAQQAAVQKQLTEAKEARVKEQQQLAKLKAEADAIAIARKKQAEAEQKQLKELAEKQVLEAKRLKELQEQKAKLVKQQEQESKKLAKIQQEKKAAKLAASAAAKKLAEVKKKPTKVATDGKAQAAKVATAKAQAASAAANQAQIAAQAATDARLASEVDKYKALIVNAIGQHWIIPDNANTSLSSQFSIRLAPDGMVLQVTLLRSSGDPLLDRSAQTAIYKAQPLPVPQDPATFNLFREISLTVRPEQIRG